MEKERDLLRVDIGVQISLNCDVFWVIVSEDVH